MDEDKLDELVAQTAQTEWQALKHFLPRRWFATPEQEAAILRQVQNMARSALDDVQRRATKDQ